MSYFRSPRTTQEKRNWFALLDWIRDGFSIKLRRSRSPRNLVDTYDDPQRGDWNHRSWKRHRTNQYKETK